jgi:hypothetical protein
MKFYARACALPLKCFFASFVLTEVNVRLFVLNEARIEHHMATAPGRLARVKAFKVRFDARDLTRKDVA